MVQIPNRFYRGVVHSTKEKSHPNFRYVLVDTIGEFKDAEGNWYTNAFESYVDYLLYDKNLGDILYGVYGSYWIDKPRSGIRITEIDNLQQAISIAQEIMGNTIVETTDLCQQTNI